jgi:hypothetical protein
MFLQWPWWLPHANYLQGRCVLVSYVTEADIQMMQRPLRHAQDKSYRIGLGDAEAEWVCSVGRMFRGNRETMCSERNWRKAEEMRCLHNVMTM